MVGPYNHYMKMSPFADFRVADIGDVHLLTTCNLEEALQDIEAFYRKIASAGVVPITAGGDHSITYPILRGIARQERVGLVHFDSHCDTAQSYGGSGLAPGVPLPQRGGIRPRKSRTHHTGGDTGRDRAALAVFL